MLRLKTYAKRSDIIHFIIFVYFLSRTNCRANNYGTRLDYIFVSAKDADDILIDCNIYPDIQGSDHCPGNNKIIFDSLVRLVSHT